MRERIRRMSGWLSAFLIMVLVLLSVSGCGSGQATGDIPVKTEETHTLSSGESQTAVQEAGAKRHSGGDSLPSGDSKTAVRDAQITVSEGESYTSKEEVALYLHLYGKLPSNFITKKEAEALGWKKEPGEAGELQNVAPGKSIGGDRFGNYEKLLPEKKGRKYFECDINYAKGTRGAERIIYSDDGLIFYTGDHYKTFEQLYPEDNSSDSDRSASFPR